MKKKTHKAITSEEVTKITKHYKKTGIPNYKDFADKYHSKYDRTSNAIRSILSKAFGKKVGLTERHRLNKVNQQPEIEFDVQKVTNEEVNIEVTPQEVLKSVENLVVSGNIKIVIDSELFTTRVFSNNVTVTSNQIIIEL